MNVFRTASCIFVAIGLMLHASPAAAQPTPISCGAAIDGYFADSDWLNVVGSRLSARGGLGFSSFTMRNGYNLATTPLGTAGAAAARIFTANKGSGHFAGPFHEVFPDRSNPDVDRWDFWVFRSGALWLRSITWGGSWSQLQGVTCYRGPASQTVMTGYFHTPGSSTEYWTFVLVGDTLI